MERIIKVLTVLVFFLATQNVKAQLAIGTTTPNASAELDIVSTTRGFLPPRLTETQRNSISNPADGLLVYCSDCNSGNHAGYYVYYNGTWNYLSTGDNLGNHTAASNIYDQSYNAGFHVLFAF